MRSSRLSSARLSSVWTASTAEPVGLPVALVDQAVGLVDEEHSAQRGVDELVGLDRGRAEVLPHQVGAVRLDHIGHLEQAEGIEDLGEHPGHCRLAGPGRAEEDEVPHRLLRGDAGHRPPPGRLDGRGDRAHLLLDRRHPDHRVELRHGVLDRDLRPRLRRGALLVARGVVGVGQRRGLGPDAVAGGTWVPGGGGSPGWPAPGLRWRRRPGRPDPGSRPGRDRPCAPPGCPLATRQPSTARASSQAAIVPIDRHGRPQLQGDGTHRHRPQQDPGDRAARHEPAGERPGVRGQGDDEGQQQERVKRGPVPAAHGGEHGQAPDRDRGGGGNGPPSLDHGDDRVDQGGDDDQAQRHREEQDGRGDHDDLQPRRGPPARAPDAGAPARLVSARAGPCRLAASRFLAPSPCLAAWSRTRREDRLTHDLRTRLPDSRMSLYSASPMIATARTSILSVKNASWSLRTSGLPADRGWPSWRTQP